MRALSILGHLIYKMAKRKLALDNIELKGNYSVSVWEPDYKRYPEFIIECHNAHQLSEVEIEQEKILLNKCFSDYINEAANAD